MKTRETLLRLLWIGQLIVALAVVAACEKVADQKNTTVLIEGRDRNQSEERAPLYRISVPEGWTIEKFSGSVADTKLPLIEFHHESSGGTVRLTVHNFPYQVVSQRIPPEAQIRRWKQQFDTLDITIVKPQAFAGFSGQCLWCEGVIEENEVAMYAWSMQLADEHEQTLSRKHARSQTRSDVTLKATGPAELMINQQDAIVRMVRSFELINPILMP